jgi:uncharacterized membrane protein YkgB
MTYLIRTLAKFGLLRDGLDYHLVRASMVLMFLLFGYQKWFEYEAQVLIPFIQNGLLISWMYPAFGTRGASWFLGIAEWATGALLLLGFWERGLVSSGRSAPARRSWGPPPSSPSCRTAGPRRPAGSRR